MIKIIERNSQDHTCAEDLNELKDDLTRCGHNSDKLEEIEPKVVLRALENTERANRATESKKQDSLVFLNTTLSRQHRAQEIDPRSGTGYQKDMWGHTNNIRNQKTSLNRKQDREEPTAG